MNNCCCCRDQLLRHLSHNRAYWFCPTCYREMPNLSQMFSASILETHQDKKLETLALTS